MPKQVTSTGFITFRQRRRFTHGPKGLPCKAVIFHAYGNVLLVSAAVLFLNVFAAFLAINRRFFLKDTGRKLSHLDKQFNVGQAEMPAPSDDEEPN